MQTAMANFQALVVGVGDYVAPGFANLPATINDATAMSAMLRDPQLCGYPADNVHTLLGEQATLENMRFALGEMARRSVLAETTLVYYSGHGGRAYEDASWHAYLCPRGADPDCLASTALSAEDFSRALAAIGGQRLVVMLDSCFASGAAELKSASSTTQWKTGWADSNYMLLSQGSGRVVIASSKEGQVSYVREQGDLSLFTYHLLAALGGKAAIRGDGLIHILDVFDYLSTAIPRDNPAQEPILKVQNADANFPIALAGLAASPTVDAATPAPAPTAPTPSTPSTPSAPCTPSTPVGSPFNYIGHIDNTGGTVAMGQTVNVGMPPSDNPTGQS